jgi:pSer/pThr/pTyr-binding forkhead associated (FHA) protein
MSLSPSARRGAAVAVPRLAPGRYLAVEDGAETVLVPLHAEVTRVSRSPAADIALDDASASRRHALFVCREDGVDVVDDRSLNGTWVNGERIERHRLADGDTIVVGRTTLRYVEVRDTGDEPAPTTRIDPV